MVIYWPPQKLNKNGFDNNAILLKSDYLEMGQLRLCYAYVMYVICKKIYQKLPEQHVKHYQFIDHLSKCTITFEGLKTPKFYRSCT